MTEPWWAYRWPGADPTGATCPLCLNARHVRQRRVTTVPAGFAHLLLPVDVICYGDMLPPDAVLVPQSAVARAVARRAAMR